MSFNLSFSILGSHDEQDVREALMSLAAKYRGVGMSLGLSADDLDAIHLKSLGDPKLALSEVISTWIKQAYNVSRFGCPSWSRVVAAVDSKAGGYNHALAKKIASEHQGRKNKYSVSTKGG